MNKKTFFFSLHALLLMTFSNLPAEQNGNESGFNIQRNLFEYNLYDRNFDRLRGRGVYDEEEEAYPNLYDYVGESDRRQTTEGRRFRGNN